jgi:hypothetical protein
MSTVLAVAVVAWTTAPAHAQWLLTPHLGVNLAGDVEFRRGGPGASVGHLGDRIGFELDFQRYQHFFKDSEVVPLDPAAPNCVPGVVGRCIDINTDAMDLMGHVVVPLRTRGATHWLPYGTAGLGLIRAWTNEKDRHQTNLGLSVGGGAIYSLSGRVGLRGDLRYARGFVDPDKRAGVYLKDYGFWRVTLGVTLR